MTGLVTIVNNDVRGYSTLFLRKLAEADVALPVKQFASVCIEREIPIIEIARSLGVTRATVYNWFTGRASPRSHQQIKMQAFIDCWPQS